MAYLIQCLLSSHSEVGGRGVLSLVSKLWFLSQEEEKPVVIRAQPVPHYGVPYKPHIPEARNVEVCPFSFDTRDKERQLQKEKKIKEMQKGEVDILFLYFAKYYSLIP